MERIRIRKNMTKNSNSLFMYPKERHIRRLSPPKYSRYRSYKISLQEEFYCRCVYCALPDVLKGHEAFGVDHYRPRSKFPGLEVEYTNLFYSCNICNSIGFLFYLCIIRYNYSNAFLQRRP